MSEEEKDETGSAPEAPPAEDEAVQESPAAAEEAPAAEEEAPAPEAEAPAAQEEAEEAPAPAEDAPAPAPTPAASAETAEPEPVVGPKERRRRARGTHTGEASPERSGEQRAADRLGERSEKAAGRRRRRATARQERVAGTGTPPAEREPGAKKIRQGTVVSDKADKTITVQVEVVRRHPVYEKVIRRSTTIHAHDERNEANAGDVVRVIESRPLSRTKRWRLIEIMEKAR